MPHVVPVRPQSRYPRAPREPGFTLFQPQLQFVKGFLLKMFLKKNPLKMSEFLKNKYFFNEISHKLILENDNFLKGKWSYTEHYFSFIFRKINDFVHRFILDHKSVDFTILVVNFTILYC
jgi:hypothetical protein